MAENALNLTFSRADGKTSRISVPNAKSDLTEVIVNGFMDLVIALDVFQPNGSALTGKEKAELVTTESTVFSIE